MVGVEGAEGLAQVARGVETVGAGVGVGEVAEVDDVDGVDDEPADAGRVGADGGGFVAGLDGLPETFLKRSCPMSCRNELKVGKDITIGSTREKIRLRSAEAVEVAKWFGLGRVRNRKRKRKVIEEETVEVELRAGTVTLIVGASGAGKSMLLRRWREEHVARGANWIELGDERFDDVPVVNCFPGQALEETLMLLGRVGLGEVWTYLKAPSELSEGQKFRLRLARGLSGLREGAVLACDEFGAVLDRVTAQVVARCLRRAIDAEGGWRRWWRRAMRTWRRRWRRRWW